MNINEIRNNTPKANSADRLAIEFEAWIGLDWGDQEHAFVLRDRSGHREQGILKHSAETLHRWLNDLAVRYGSRPVALAIESSRGPVIEVLLQYPWLTVYPINPVTSARYRRAFVPSGAKDDLPDADVLLDLVLVHADKLRALERDEETVTLRALVEARRDMVDQRTRVVLKLTSLLKTYYPQALELVGDLKTELATAFLKRWPDLITLKSAKSGLVKRFLYQHRIRSTKLMEKRLQLITQAVALTTDEARVKVAVLQLRQMVEQLDVFRKHIKLIDAEIKETFATHPNADLFRHLPGAGAQLAPRLCVAFGTIRTRFPDPASLQKYSGVAPVREKSGNQLWTHWRWQAPTFLRQTFVEWAGQTVHFCPWARMYYDRRLKKNKKHAVILRALAFKWIRVLWKCWQEQTPYNEARYLKQLIHRKSPNAVRMAPQTQAL
jgi:transposase